MKSAFLTTALIVSNIAAAAPAIDGWYGSVFGGYTSLSTNIRLYYNDNITSEVSFKDGYNVGGRIGYQSNPLRYEFEYTYLNATPDYFKINSYRFRDIRGNTSINFAMVNLYYDFPEILLNLSPFVGAGIGYAYLQTDLKNSNPFGYSYFKLSDNEFAYQGTAGLTFNFSDSFAVNAAYRYTATTNSSNFGRAVQAQMGSAGVVYRFDNVRYK